MNIGTFEDTAKLLSIVGEDVMREVLKSAEIGMFNARSWHYWHYRLGLAKDETDMTSMPVRQLPASSIKANLYAL